MVGGDAELLRGIVELFGDVEEGFEGIGGASDEAEEVPGGPEDNFEGDEEAC